MIRSSRDTIRLQRFGDIIGFFARERIDNTCIGGMLLLDEVCHFFNYLFFHKHCAQFANGGYVSVD